jgi:hypothetical protein
MAAARRVKAAGGSARQAVSDAVERVREAVGGESGGSQTGGGESGSGSMPAL